MYLNGEIYRRTLKRADETWLYFCVTEEANVYLVWLEDWGDGSGIKLERTIAQTFPWVPGSTPDPLHAYKDLQRAAAIEHAVALYFEARAVEELAAEAAARAALTEPEQAAADARADGGNKEEQPA